MPLCSRSTALDSFGNTATSYTGTVHFTSTDGQANLPANTVLTSGTGNFAGILKTAGVQTIVATDTVNAGITASSNPITVSPSTTTHFVITGARPPSKPTRRSASR